MKLTVACCFFVIILFCDTHKEPLCCNIEKLREIYRYNIILVCYRKRFLAKVKSDKELLESIVTYEIAPNKKEIIYFYSIIELLGKN